MDMSLVNKEHRAVCPYNSSHLVDPARMQIHLQKCKRSYPDIQLTVCPFNATHHVREDSLRAHILSCPNKDIVERDLFYRHNPEFVNRKNDFFVEVPKESNSEYQAEDNEEPSWDTGIPVNSKQSFNPEVAVLQRQVPRNIPFGFGKSGKKKFREVDMERIRRLKEGEPIDDLIYPTPGGGSISIAELLRGSDHETGATDVPSANLECSSSNRDAPNIMKTDRALRLPVSKNIIESTRNHHHGRNNPNDDFDNTFGSSFDNSLPKMGRGKGGLPSYAQLNSVSNIFKNLNN